MKRILFALLALAALLAACGSGAASSEAAPPAPSAPASSEAPASSPPTDTGEAAELVVFAAASMTKTLEEVAALYKAVAPNVTLTFNFDSSGTLKTQIQEGAACDLFLSAGQKQMNELDSAAGPQLNPEGLDFVLLGSRVNLLENRVTLCVPEGNPGKIAGFDDLAGRLAGEDLLLAMGNSDVPVGQYTAKILAFYGLEEEALANGGRITYGSNVKEVTTQISEGSVDCGVVYCTDAHSAGLEIVDYATPEMCGRAIYPAAVLNTSRQQAEAQAFLDYLHTADAMAVFESVGFAAA